MPSRAVVRLVLGSLVVAGAVTLAVSIGPAQAQRPVGSAVRVVLEATLDRPRPTPAGPLPVDLDALAAVLPGGGELGPVHVDPVPDGISLEDPTDTAALYARAGQPELAQEYAGADVPPGTPSISTLSEHVLPSCSGTGSDGKRVQALYVREQSTASRYASVLPLLRNEIANVDDVFALSAEQSGGVRRVRWVHDGCVPVVPEVVVPDGSLNTDFRDTIAALKTLGFSDKNRKYLAFTEASDLCGVGTTYDDVRTTDNVNDGYAASYSRVDTVCWSVQQHSVVAHELTHNLGGVLLTAPHATDAGHCYDEADLMCYVDDAGVVMQTVCGSAQEQLLDCRGDDYFNTAPPAGSFLAGSWNTARSGFLDTALGAQTEARATLWSAPTASPGDPALVSATLSEAGVPLAGAVVELQTRADTGQPWQIAVSGLVATADGRVAVERRRTTAGWYRYVYAGESGAHDASSSGGVLVKAKSRATADWKAARKVVAGRLVLVGGVPLAGEPVLLQRRYTGGRWVTVTRVTSAADGRLAVRQRPKRTAYFRWVFRGDDRLLPARSAAVRAR